MLKLLSILEELNITAKEKNVLQSISVEKVKGPTENKINPKLILTFQSVTVKFQSQNLLTWPQCFVSCHYKAEGISCQSNNFLNPTD